MQFIIHVSCLIESDGRLLLVREGKPECRGKWNLPGGHLEPGEELAAGAAREVREETGLDVAIEALAGVYSGRGEHHFIQFVFEGRADAGEPQPGSEDILECAWFEIAALNDMDDEAFLNPEKFRMILGHWLSGQRLPVENVGEWVKR